MENGILTCYLKKTIMKSTLYFGKATGKKYMWKTSALSFCIKVFNMFCKIKIWFSSYFFHLMLLFFCHTVSLGTLRELEDRSAESCVLNSLCALRAVLLPGLWEGEDPFFFLLLPGSPPPLPLHLLCILLAPLHRHPAASMDTNTPSACVRFYGAFCVVLFL